ncbi:S9 family peptidase [Thalassotalea marina]|uniref:Peptidase S9 n=1 Tax=Thalassotalea marina TaxID=1673741 RepID=A0A919BRP2_9GAMM|nr:prolyl oligopeptidase family serine peptidase [Thalassotalea marina]GHG06257.1 peptidase S9 [Thalassotalea marina]
MKIKLLSAAISLSLVGCVTTNEEQSAEAILNAPAQEINEQASAPVAINKEVKTAVSKNVVAKQSTNTLNTIITLEKAMSDPDWIGRAPESWYWGDDSNTIFFNRKQEGNPLRDLFQKSINEKGNGAKVPLAQMHIASDRNAVENKAGTQEAYTFKGNVFVKDLASGKVRQLTHTSAYESSVMFLNNGNIAYRVGNKFFEHDLNNNGVKELASLVFSNDPSKKTSEKSYLAQEQSELIDYIALQQRNKELRDAASDKLKAENSTITKSEFYLGKGKRVAHASLSPSGDKLIVSIADSKSSRAATDIMPKYVTDNGDIEPAKVRARVADNAKYSEETFLLDLKTGQKFPLSYENLPGFDEDVLAAVKKENHKREGKTYESKKSPRDIHVMRSYNAIKWHEDGNKVAMLFRAWDNKDRWLATVDLLENKLVSQHRLHDDAWINWSFNEFGWAGDKLYYLSEESGYSHLYLKSLKGKAKKLTSGNFEVSDLTLTDDESSIIFRANKKHPGIYEIYQINLASAKMEPLTNLGGMNDYALSPDGTKLLIEHSQVTMPPELFVKDLAVDAQAIQLTHTVSEEFKAMPWTAPNVVAVPSSYQEDPVYSRVYLPKDFDKKAQKNKAVMFSHGAGYLQNAHLGWSGYFREFMFHSMLVQQGYVVIDMDYRASKGYGRDWRTAIYRHMGKPEVQDMKDGVNWLVENANVDPNRVGTYGGSYGGFLTLMALFTEPDTFQSGAALRLVSDWAYYNHGYTSNILNTPGDDAIAYERSSPIYFAEGLKKPLLINAPMIDDNVFFQDSVRLVQRLIELEKENFETAIYPVEPHGFIQPSSWLDEYRRIYKLFENTL